MRKACEEAGVPFKEVRAKQVEEATAAKAREEALRTPEKLEQETEADDEEAALAMVQRERVAEERARKARNERLTLEAMEDPKKILPYLKTLEPELTDPFLNLCKETGLKPEKGIAEAVKKFKTWREYSHSVEEPDFKNYLKEMLDAWMSERHLKLALERHREDHYRLTCESCSLRYEYEFKEKGALLSCPNGCPTRDGYTSFFKLCLVCLDLGKENCLFYNPSSNVMYCKVCGHRAQVKDQPLKEKGTKKGALKREVADLEESKRALDGELRETQRKINIGEEREQAIERGIGEKQQTYANLNKNIATLSAESEKKKQECEAELRRAEKLKGENKHVEERRKVFAAVAEFLVDPELITGDQLANVVNTLSVALDMRKQQGHVGESVKMTVEERDWLVEKLAGGRYILREEADKKREQELAQQRHKHEGEIEALRREHITEIKKQKMEYDHKIEEQRIEYEKKIKKLEGEVRRLEKELSSVRGPQSPPQRTPHMKLIKEGRLDPHD